MATGYLSKSFNCASRSETGFGFGLGMDTQKADNTVPTKGLMSFIAPDLKSIPNVDAGAVSKINAGQKSGASMANAAAGSLKTNLDSVNGSIGGMKDAIKKTQASIAESAKDMGINIGDIAPKEAMPNTGIELFGTALAANMLGMIGAGKSMAAALKHSDQVQNANFFITDIKKGAGMKQVKRQIEELEESIKSSAGVVDIRKDGFVSLLSDSKQQKNPDIKPNKNLAKAIEAGHGVQEIMQLDADNPNLPEFQKALDVKHAIEGGIEHVERVQKDIRDNGFEKGGDDVTAILRESKNETVKEQFNQSAAEIQKQSTDSLGYLKLKIQNKDDIKVLDNKDVKSALNNEPDLHQLVGLEKTGMSLGSAA